MFTLLNYRTITEADALKMHYMFYREIDADSSGKYHSESVIITGSKYSVGQPEMIQAEMDYLFQ